MKTKIILLTGLVLIVFSFVGITYATSSSLYVSPSDLTKTIGDTFNVSVGFNALGNKVCAVEGTLVFNNLSCQSITTTDGLMTQSSPTCSNPHFLIGIPNCTTTDKVLLTTSVKAGSAAASSLSVTNVDLIGEGASVGSASVSGNYTINSLPIVQSQTSSIQEPEAKKTVEKNTPVKEKIKGIVKTTSPETINLQATPVEAVKGNGWFFSNFIWIIVLLISTISAYFVGRMNYKK